MNLHHLDAYDYALPSELIAQSPAVQRRDARLLDGRHATPRDTWFTDLPNMLRSGDVLVLNDTQVLKARLWGHKASGGKVELLVERVLGEAGLEAAVHMRVSRKPKVGERLYVAGLNDTTKKAYQATVLGRWPDSDGALFHLRFGAPLAEVMANVGHVPLPPYIQHADSEADQQRYQTVFAKHPGAVAAPTAALHFDQDMLQGLQTQGVELAYVTLHVGAGTFAPVKTADVRHHTMHSEWYQVPEATQRCLAQCRARGGRVVAVGTTSVRTLESWAYTGQAQGETQLFITPGFQFQWVDWLVTNFHLPKSTLMMLVSALAGHDHVMQLYAHAVAQRYRFFSYGDAMLLQRASA
ncbi:MAG: tRNA preQ1(34) S-adenosylmethionine ribosyltransferase-isomerase QueA [Proteobacteria bacterium]|nr:tRNA preQ1(34) S-adenosylmethionine ribosyltransferase-isomerase QueA [Pseudomonadota bacterium]